MEKIEISLICDSLFNTKETDISMKILFDLFMQNTNIYNENSLFYLVNQLNIAIVFNLTKPVESEDKASGK